MKFSRRFSILIIGVLLLAACGSTADTATDLVDQVADEAVATEGDEAEETAEAAPVEETMPTPPPTTAAPEPVAPEPVSATTVPETTSDDFPDILAAQATPAADGFWRFDVTVSSTYDTPERYADAWRVVGPDGSEFGIRVLTHHHANEQPFTRSHSIEIPEGVTEVTIEGRDLANGWGGGTLALSLG